jgi:hypothetical protein
MSDSSGISDFINQVGGLLALTCVAGIIWLIMFGLIMQRANERRRRQKEGLPPLPGFHVIWWNRIKQMLSGQSPAPLTEPDLSSRLTRTASAPKPRPKTTIPAGLSAPDLSLLTSDLSAPPPAPKWEPAEPEPYKAVEEPAASFDYAADPIPQDLPPAAEPPDSIELLRVWRDLSTGSLVVEIGGQQFNSLEHLRNADLERRFVNVVRELDGLSQPKGSKPTQAPRATISPATGKDEAPPPPSLGPVSMFRQMGRAAIGQTPTTPEVSAPQTIADQIEDLLQARLAKLPSFQGRTIHVRPSVDGGVRIEIDERFYDGIGDVDDPDVRALLGDVVREWESKQ